MSDKDLMRASDEERQQVVDRLRAALEEGRLRMDEFTDRVGQAFQAVTYADLARLHADLPAARPAPAAAPAVAPAPGGQVADRSAFAELPGALKVLWTIWGAAVSINIVVWVLVVATTANWVYPWPLWVAGPAGAALMAISVPVVHNRRIRRRSAPPPAARPDGPPPLES